MAESTAPTVALPPVPGGLTAWPDEAKVLYCNLRARKVGRARAWRQIKASFPDLKLGKSPSGAIAKWEYREAKDYIAAVRANLVSDMKSLPYSQKWERVATQGEMVLVLLDRFHAEDDKGEGASVPDLTSLSKEIRPLLSAIRSELEGEGVDDSRLLSVFERIENKLKEVRSDRADDLGIN